MTKTEIIEEALKLPPDERALIIEELQKSLDVPHPSIDRIWIEEAERRLAAFRAGRIGSVSLEEVFNSPPIRLD